MKKMTDYDKGLKEATIELTSALKAVDGALEKMKRYGVTSYILDSSFSGGTSPTVCVRNGIKELAEIMGVKINLKADWLGKPDGLRCTTHGVQFWQTTKREVDHYEPRRKEAKQPDAG